MQGSYKQQKFITKVGVIFPFPLFHAVATKQIYCQKLGFIKPT